MQKETIIRSAGKKGTQTANSRYTFHFTSYPVSGKISFYEGSFQNPQLNKSQHYHKIMTEIFTVLEGRFFFDIGNREHVLQPGDTVIIPPLVVHGFRAALPGSRLQFVSTGITEREAFFEGLAKIVNGELTLNEAELEAFYNSHDQYTVR